MTIWEVLIGAPATLMIVVIIIFAIISFALLIAGLPALIANFYKNYKNQDKISLKRILRKTYF
ncbi:hypothetical protein A2819_01690 [Candidatus Azambacteria bacterium RIFCSPHIGHO2_01_FULL_40_24]|uniref:Uncharacterized protein n=1 Tax=Candidatus Azambacteria bacterium RIFCSPHIGHO2_01_FULL_40_24 TaxID=1797301 RepID=A0A1F5B358_9BACT|nr:MAG: hypothetical protein A2819_01690 [Candidatus Azambacteria bacterium RIFCSPHIGHO2_01_FULL_40_24]